MRITKLVPALVVFVCASPALAQQEAFEWQRGTEESVRLDPANYHGGKSYGSQGGTIHVDIDAQQPVSIFMTGVGEWNRAMQNPEMLSSIRMVCQRVAPKANEVDNRYREQVAIRPGPRTTIGVWKPDSATTSAWPATCGNSSNVWRVSTSSVVRFRSAGDREHADRRGRDHEGRGP
jgi:hypothetical protein